MIFSKIFFCTTHRRFQRLYNKLEAQGYNLWVRDDPNDVTYPKRVRVYSKNLAKVNRLYEKFTGK